MAKVGRPTKYTPEACEVVLTLGAEGQSRAVMAAELDVAISTFQDWEETNPEFRVATSRARDLALAWWERQGIKGIWSKDFNANAYRLQVMNRFPAAWRDKQEVDNRFPEGVTVEVINRVVETRPANRMTEHMSPNGNGASHP